jgi:response regulator of citrate/malate metabolism
MPRASGLQILKQAKENDPYVQVVVVTGEASLETAVEALNEGAFSYLMKPLDDVVSFHAIIKNALEIRRLTLDNLRMGEIQRRRGDLLEEEVTQRIRQLQRSERELIGVLACLSEGVIVMARNGRIVFSNTVAERWLAQELMLSEQPIRQFLEHSESESLPARKIIRIKDWTLELIAASLAESDRSLKKVITISERPEELIRLATQAHQVLGRLKKGLAWLFQRSQEADEKDAIRYLAHQVNELEGDLIKDTMEYSGNKKNESNSRSTSSNITEKE